LDLYNEIADDPKIYIDMELEKGDIQFLSNHFVLHSRTAYEDYENPKERRHLLRLWISLENQLSFKSILEKEWMKLQLVTELLIKRIRHLF